MDMATFEMNQAETKIVVKNAFNKLGYEFDEPAWHGSNAVRFYGGNKGNLFFDDLDAAKKWLTDNHVPFGIPEEQADKTKNIDKEKWMQALKSEISR